MPIQRRVLRAGDTVYSSGERFTSLHIVHSGRGLRTEQVTLRMTRAEIANYLGMRLESVSRAFTRLERAQVICFTEKGRRDVQIPDVGALARFVQQAQAPTATMQ